LGLAAVNLPTHLERSYVVDTTELVSFMLNRNGLAGKIIRSLVLDLFTQYIAIDEIWKHKDDWFRRRPNLSLDDFTETLSWYIKIAYVDRNSNEFALAYERMKNIDLNDVEFLALALKLKIPIWSEDDDYKSQPLVKVFTSRDIARLSSQLPELWLAINQQ
jgi:predicted nucleic acid-binding protein